MNNLRFFFGIIHIAALLMILSGCAQLTPETRPLPDEKAGLIASQARSFNQHIISSKGTGFVTLKTKKKSDRLKIAWAAIFPDKIRITFLMSGLPVETIIATGEKITFVSHTGEHPRHSYYSKDPDMEDYIHVPVKMSEIISVLLGRLPIREFDEAFFTPSDAPCPGIRLKKNRRAMTQTLHMNSEGKPDHLQSTTSKGKLLYEIRIANYQSYDFGDIPVNLEINDVDNQKLLVEIKSFQANPAIKESVFQLTE